MIEDAELLRRYVEDCAAAAEQATSDVRRSLAEARTARAAEKQRAMAAAAAARAADVAAHDAFVARHPEVQRAFIDYLRTNAGAEFRPLFRMLHLSPAQIEQFEDLVTQGGIHYFFGPDGQSWAVSAGGDRPGAQKQLRALLGDEGFRQYKEILNTGPPSFQMAEELAGSLYYTPTPLTAEQADQLMRVLTAHYVAVDWSSMPQYEWEAIMPEAHGVLSEAQLAMFDFYRATNVLSQAMTQARRRGTAPLAGAAASVAPAK